jgi:hypothetical protein
MLIRQSSVSDFVAFASNHEYLAGIGHRTAVLEDSRLLPVADRPLRVAVDDGANPRNRIRPPDRRRPREAGKSLS